MKKLLKKMLSSLLILSAVSTALPSSPVQAAQRAGTRPDVPEIVLEQRQLRDQRDPQEILQLRRLHDQDFKNKEQLETFRTQSIESNALPAYRIETSRPSAKRDEVVWFTVTFNVDQSYEGGYLWLFNPASYDYALVSLDRITGTKFEGSLYVGNFIEPGSYTLDEIIMYKGDLYDSVEPDQSGFLTISGTAGDAYPALNISFDKTVYNTYETATVRVTNTKGLEDYRICMLFLTEGYAELIQQPDGSYSGELLFDEYFQTGSVGVDFLVFSNPYDAVYVQNSPDANLGTEYQDFSSVGFEVRDVPADVTNPVFNSITAAPTTIARNGESVLTVNASDAGSGVRSVTVFLSDGTYVDLMPADGTSWKGVYKPDPFAPVFSPVEILAVDIEDTAFNYELVYSDWDYEPIMIYVGQYPFVGEIHGGNRNKTAVQVSRYFDPSNTVILATSTDFPDALAAGPLSKVLQAPILLTGKDTIPPETLSEIKRRGAAKVIVMGGPLAVSDAVMNTLKANGINSIRRIAGSSRYATALMVADELEGKRMLGSNHSAFLTSGSDFPDALSVGSWAAGQELPILLNPASALRSDVKSYLQTNRINKVYLIGGTLAISDTVKNELVSLGISVERISGSNRYNTSVAVAKKFFGGVTNAFVSSGTSFADALAAAPLAGQFPAPLLLVQSQTLPSGVSTFLRDPAVSSIRFVTAVGGELAVGSEVKNALNTILLTLN